jgi:hypothetical protein
LQWETAKTSSAMAIFLGKVYLNQTNHGPRPERSPNRMDELLRVFRNQYERSSKEPE